MLIIGDVLAVVASLIGICVSLWATLVGTALLFSARSDRARLVAENSPWRSFGVGVGVALTIGVLSAILLANPAPLGRLLGFLGAGALCSWVALGAAGVASLLADRLQARDRDITPVAALSRAAAIIVTACLVPFFGWFFVAPILVLVFLGAGTQSVLGRERRARTVPEAASSGPSAA